MRTEQTNGIDDDVDVEIGTLESMLEGSTALEAVDRASIDVQVSTAKKYPRSVDKSLKEARTLATLDEETAASMFYVLPRSGKKIEGPSARLAEVMAYSWGNLRADADIVAEDRTHVTAMGTCFDLEKNVAIRVRVKRRITDRHGKRYNEDMIGVTCNAAISIALRNAVFKVIPAAMVRKVYHEARRASIGKAGTMTQKRQKVMEWFGKAGVEASEIFALLEVGGADDIGEEELITLRGLATAIKDGETTVEQVFRDTGNGAGADELNEAAKSKAKKGSKRESEDDDATDSAVADLRALVEKAREAGAMDLDLEANAADAMESGEKGEITDAKKRVSAALVKAEKGKEASDG